MDDIHVTLEALLKARGMTSKELAEKIGITEANLSILRTGKAKGIRFGTLSRICKALDCQPGELLEYRPTITDD
ncbi:UNVERIFIED_CONTAM: helix-turn-helix transcriptional regulator [Streptococcus canis]|uniref:Helix-turn-helix transcriptional regulator n=2 Tax=Streptococcus canis TaxID=1329 RepID=A0AAE4TIX0_STRCB|nr:helix-turn-helix transcriptional regulator [Streptococcus canis]MDV5976624.1 helix-turn-helix transcriptional regulator [Streptococcus canis]MDW7796250.1 helix-turn-helix transcriptional regulator [Streptococcus canis]QJD11572.1 helix-turn-helix transcriptional regulator [Streptococcus canis]QKG73009.1 helix-turn-helix transcriptional regulator [Streptococcus canis]QKG74951.1 helix-turn-helix transcriptional regulator [Streptococcus canis]